MNKSAKEVSPTLSGRMEDFLRNQDKMPWKHLGIAAGGGIGAGILATLLMSYKKKNSTKDNIKLYQAIESPNADEESIIDENIYKNSSVADAAVYGAAGVIPAYLALSTIKDKMQRTKTDEGRVEVGELRDAVNSAYREDMLKAYGVEDEDQLKAMVEDLENRAGIEKTSGAIPISAAAATTGAGALGLTGFLSMKHLADRANPTRMQNKGYLDKLDRLYRELLVSPTINELPLSDEELMALELYKQESNKRVKQLDESPKPIEIPEGAEEISMDDPDIQSIMEEL